MQGGRERGVLGAKRGRRRRRDGGTRIALCRRWVTRAETRPVAMAFANDVARQRDLLIVLPV